VNVATSICTCRFANAAERFSANRAAVAWLYPVDCLPVHSRDWYAAHAVATVASASSTADTSSHGGFARVLRSLAVEPSRSVVDSSCTVRSLSRRWTGCHRRARSLVPRHPMRAMPHTHVPAPHELTEGREEAPARRALRKLFAR
jgi:hypothetical protein